MNKRKQTPALRNKEVPVKILVLAGGFPPAHRGGGPIRTVSALVKSLDPSKFEVRVVTSDRDLGQRNRMDVRSNQWIENDSFYVSYVSTDRASQLARAVRMVRGFRPDIIYVNSYFSPYFSFLPRVLTALGVWGKPKPVVIMAPRGEFGSGLGEFRGKKRFYTILHRSCRYLLPSLWHASSEIEKRDITRVMGHQQPVVVRENETGLPVTCSCATVVLQDIVRLVFIGRIHPNKGLLTAINAMADSGGAVELVAYGPAEDPFYLEQCLTAGKELPNGSSFRYMGELGHDHVRSKFAEYDAFIFPTKSENFGHVIAEALSVSCPVLCADTTPWSDVLEGGGGTVVRPNNPTAWAKAVRYWSGLSADERLERKVLAGRAYDEWRSCADGPNVFELAIDVLEPSTVPPRDN